MNELSRYVLKVGDSYLNSMTKQRLPLNSSEDDLRRGMFLKGQEAEALESRLFSKPKSLHLRLLPTWECNLRCKHCSVLQNLKRNDPCRIKPRDVANFCASHMERYEHKSISLSLLGGECLLEADFCLEVLSLLERENPDARIFSSLTTNFAVTLNETMVELLSKLTDFQVSLDGEEEQHNWQRKGSSGSNPYAKTLANIKRAVKLGFADKMKVQAAIQQEVFDAEKKKEYFRTLAKIGVTDIVYGHCHPSKHNPTPDDMYLHHLKMPKITNRPCCEYRWMNFFAVNSDNSLFSEYFSMEGRFGDLGEVDFERIEALYRNKIEKNMAVLNDEVCREQCPVLAYCWGRCVTHELYLEEFRKSPSKFCGKEDLEKKIGGLAVAGSL